MKIFLFTLLTFMIIARVSFADSVTFTCKAKAGPGTSVIAIDKKQMVAIVKSISGNVIVRNYASCGATQFGVGAYLVQCGRGPAAGDSIIEAHTHLDQAYISASGKDLAWLSTDVQSSSDSGEVPPQTNYDSEEVCTKK